MLPTVIYDQLKFWLPLVSGFVLAYKGFKSLKKSIDGWAETLFTNHLAHIQEATIDTVTATKETNSLLEQRALRDLEVAKQVAEVKAELAVSKSHVIDGVSAVRNDIKHHEEKETAVWMGVVNTLSLLEDRSRQPTPRTPRRRR